MFLLGAQDVGPAKVLIELGRHLKGVVFCVGSTLTSDLFKKSGLKLNPNWEKSNPLVIITGTCLGNFLDKKLTIWARQESIPSISFIEHWGWYRKRFELNGELILPDFILVNDDIAYADAVNEGLPSEKVIVAGNPVLEALNVCSSQKSIQKDKLLRDYKLPKKRLILFISEELASDFNGTSDALGYDEFLVVDQILTLLTPEEHLVIKLHPAEAEDKYQYLDITRVSVIKTIDIHSLNMIADVVIGMASMLLLELAMIRSDVISFRPNATKPFIGDRLSATVGVTSQNGLMNALRFPTQVVGNFQKKFEGSLARIVSIIEYIAK